MKPKLQYLVESSTNEWYTPHHIVKSVKAVFGGVIDLDPYSCDAANAIVGATTYYTKEDDAFLSDWPVVDNVFANPPYEWLYFSESKLIVNWSKNYLTSQLVVC